MEHAGIEVEIGPILDWSVTVEAEAQVCVQTGMGWYRVAGAAQEYEPLFFMPLLFARLCKYVIKSIQEMPAVELNGLLVLVCKYLLQTQAKESLLFHIKVCILTSPDQHIRSSSGSATIPYLCH